VKRYIIHKDTSITTPFIDYEKELNEEQLKVVLSANGPILVIAGQKGKTRVVTYQSRDF
jgi:hypothetical protein